MAVKEIIIKGAAVHNLKHIDLAIPREKLVVITGLSGSGKSSLAFDTIYAEGQRRYVESLSVYARQFLAQMEKPDVEFIEGLSPAIAIEQKTISRNPRSTVGTLTEIHDYLRLLFARVGKPFCYKCGREITSRTIDQIVDRVVCLPSGTRIMIMAPLVRGRKGEYKALLAKIARRGFIRARIDGTLHGTEEDIALDKNKKHNIDIVVDRLEMRKGVEKRVADSLETALALAEGLALVATDGGEETLYAQKMSCPDCDVSLPELSPRAFSFNSPHGACPVCAGLGTMMNFTEEKIIPDPALSIEEGALLPWRNTSSTYLFQMLHAAMSHYGFSLQTPYGSLSKKAKKILLYGSDEEIDFTLNGERYKHAFRRKFEGIINHLSRRYRETKSQEIREQLERFMSNDPCLECGGTRLRKEILAVKIDLMNIADITSLSVTAAAKFFASLKLTRSQQKIAGRILKELKERLGFLENIGVSYLSLDRASGTLSAGEAQRIRLANQIGSTLTGVLYILDEPSIGLHQKDNERLIRSLATMRDKGNTVIVVEHDEKTIRSADFIVDLGVGAGIHGGEVVYAGPPKGIVREKRSITGQYLKGTKRIETPKSRRQAKGFLTIAGAAEHNLKNIDVAVPLGVFTVVTGVSGSGKSTLINAVLYRALSRRMYGSSLTPGKHKAIRGAEKINRVINIDQSPIGRTPRSNPATYTGLFTPLRELFSRVPEARMRGFKPGRFSFNVKGGRCEACEGGGVKKVEMYFLPDIYVTCDVCKGKRYNRETLDVLYKGKNISDVLEMTAEQARDFFSNVPVLKRKLQTLTDVGLDYIHLGQSATTLSGGEAQRVKLSRELSKIATGDTLYILDEPTTGLHFDDVHKLLNILGRLTDAGNTVIVIEHNLDIIRNADHVIDLGPKGGDEGGRVVISGAPEEIAAFSGSYTGRYLKEVL